MFEVFKATNGNFYWRQKTRVEALAFMEPLNNETAADLVVT